MMVQGKLYTVMNMPPPPTEKAFLSNSRVIGRHIRVIANETIKKAKKKIFLIRSKATRLELNLSTVFTRHAIENFWAPELSFNAVKNRQCQAGREYPQEYSRRKPPGIIPDFFKLESPW